MVRGLRNCISFQFYVTILSGALFRLPVFICFFQMFHFFIDQRTEDVPGILRSGLEIRDFQGIFLEVEKSSEESL